MKPEQLMQVWAAAYAAEYVRMSAVPLSGLVQNIAGEAAKTADYAVEDLLSSGHTPTFKGYENL